MPIIYNPVVIRPGDYPDGSLPNWVNGVWVDGGYLDNIPLHVIDNEEGPNPKTLGLRLGLADEQPARINNIMDFLITWGMFGVWGTGEAHVNEPNLNLPQTILFDTAGLDTLDFTPEPADRDRVIEQARQNTLAYFDE
jgi:predicted acylesterase/phospholipase RssA